MGKLKFVIPIIIAFILLCNTFACSKKNKNDLFFPGTGAGTGTDTIPSISQGDSTSIFVLENSLSSDSANQLILSATDLDAPANSLTWTVSVAAINGTALIISGSPSSSGGFVTVGYQPNGGFVGSESFDVKVDDGQGSSDTITVNVVVSSSIFWVDQNHLSASDTNPGTSSLPWATVGKAAQTLTAGQTVMVKSGTYQEEVEPLNSGTTSQPITYAVAPGETVTLDGVLAGSSPEGFRLDATESHIIIDGFRITRFDESIYVLNGPHTNLTFRSILLFNNGRGMLLREADNVSVIDCEFDANQGEGFGAMNCNNLTVKRCYSHNNDDGLGAAGDADGFWANYCDNALFEECRAVDNSEDGFDLTSDCTLKSCLASGHGAVGFKIWRRDGDGFAPKRHRLFNCLSFNNAEVGLKSSEGPDLEIYGCVFAHNAEMGIRIIDNTHGGSPDLIIKNTLVAWNSPATTYGGLTIGSGWTPDIDFNCYYSNGGTDTPLTEPGSVFADPLVQDAAGRDYHLTDTSPLRNAGADLTAAGLHMDYDGVTRPQEGQFDIGAYEYKP